MTALERCAEFIKNGQCHSYFESVGHDGIEIRTEHISLETFIVKYLRADPKPIIEQLEKDGIVKKNEGVPSSS